jgi:hypothetical protein
LDSISDPGFVMALVLNRNSWLGRHGFVFVKGTRRTHFTTLVGTPIWFVCLIFAIPPAIELYRIGRVQPADQDGAVPVVASARAALDTVPWTSFVLFLIGVVTLFLTGVMAIFFAIELGKVDNSGSSISFAVFSLMVLAYVIYGFGICWIGFSTAEKYVRANRRLRARLCPICGYDLRATPHQCPECGHSIEAAKS